MNEEGVNRIISVVEMMNELSKKLEKAIDRKDSDSILEIKKEILDLQRQVNSLI